MAAGAGDALLQVPGIGAFLEHFHVVVGFEVRSVDGLQNLLQAAEGVAEVGKDGEFPAFAFDDEDDAVGGVVRCRDGVHGDRAEGEGIASGEEPNVA